MIKLDQENQKYDLGQLAFTSDLSGTLLPAPAFVSEGLKPEVLQGGHGLAIGLGARCQMVGVALHRIALELERIDLLEPRILVGREDAEWHGALGQDLVTLKHHMVFAGQEADAVVRQGAAYSSVPPNGLRLVVMVGEYRLCAQRFCQGWNGS